MKTLSQPCRLSGLQLNATLTVRCISSFSIYFIILLTLTFLPVLRGTAVEVGFLPTWFYKVYETQKFKKFFDNFDSMYDYAELFIGRGIKELEEKSCKPSKETAWPSVTERDRAWPSWLLRVPPGQRNADEGWPVGERNRCSVCRSLHYVQHDAMGSSLVGQKSWETEDSSTGSALSG